MRLVLSGGLARLLASFGTVIISFAVVRAGSAELWGGVVSYAILIDISFAVIGWGATPYLVRRFSLSPKDRTRDWAIATASRSLLLATLVLLIALFAVPTKFKLLLIGWAIARFTYQSFEPMIQFERPFLLSLTVELSAILLVVAPAWLLHRELTLATVIFLLAFSIAFKAAILAWHFRKKLRWTAPSAKYFAAALPFLLLTFSAMLQQRADLYNVAYFLDRRAIGAYQVFNSLLLVCIFVASMFFTPFEKNLLRLPQQTFAKFERNFILAGVLLSAVSIVGVYVVIRYCYRLNVPLGMYGFGYFYVLIYYGYALQCCLFARAGKLLQMSYFTFAGCATNLSLGAILTTRFGLEGAIAAATASQLVVGFLYRFPRTQPRAASL